MNASPMLPDALFLWYLGQPEMPRLIGTLNLVLGRRAVSLKYADDWLKTGFPISEDLPLIDLEHFPKEKDRAAGGVDDARPDRWGERVIRLLDRPQRLSLLDYLYYAGDDRFGALGVSLSAACYLPREIGPLPKLADVDAIHAVVGRVLASEAIDEREKRLITPGVTMGGARPKALCKLDGEAWILKFAEEDRPDEALIEHAAMTLAARAGIEVAKTRTIPMLRGVALAVRRFDRSNGRRWHALSVNVVLRAAGVSLSYPELAQLLRRRGPVERHRAQMRELFRRLIFNILIDNTDDHEKNHVVLVQDDQQYVLAPAFDVLPIAQSLGYQGMDIGDDGAESTVDNAFSAADQYWLTDTQARAEARQVAVQVQAWREHFLAQGVSTASCDALACHIDRPFLREQRLSLL